MTRSNLIILLLTQVLVATSIFEWSVIVEIHSPLNDRDPNKIPEEDQYDLTRLLVSNTLQSGATSDHSSVLS
jgi:hypothetical protein